MNIIKKLKSKRGITLAEVLVVVAIMAIMLSIAVPDLLAESEKIKMSAMDGYARSVAVAVQSKLYGMKNAGTAEGSEYSLLGNVAEKANIGTDGEKTVKYVTNFGDKGAIGKAYLLSGALTARSSWSTIPSRRTCWKFFTAKRNFPSKICFLL